jgi:hypothetical protein
MSHTVERRRVERRANIYASGQHVAEAVKQLQYLLSRYGNRRVVEEDAKDSFDQRTDRMFVESALGRLDLALSFLPDRPATAVPPGEGSPMIRMGWRVRDSVTGYEGIVIGRTEWMYGCTRIGVQQAGLHEGKPRDPEWFDEQRLHVIEMAVVECSPESSAVTGGPQRDPSQPRNPVR